MFPLTDLHYRVSHIQIYTTDFPFALQNICVPSEWSLKICLNVVILPAFKHIALSSSWAMFLTHCRVHVGVPVLAEVDYFLRLYVPGHGQMKHTIELYFYVKKFSFMSLEWLEFWRMRCWVSRWYCEGSANLWVHVLLCTFLVGIPAEDDGLTTDDAWEGSILPSAWWTDTGYWIQQALLILFCTDLRCFINTWRTDPDRLILDSFWWFRSGILLCW